MKNPYSDLPDHHFWRRGVAGVDPHAFNPVVDPKFRISKDQRVVTAGSCFAQHISRRLSGLGFNYFIPENGGHLSEAERVRLGYGVFSARFGNIYTTRQLLQLLQEAMGLRPKTERAWARPDGRFVDPFRPSVTPEGFAAPDEVTAARVEHLAKVKRMFTEAEVLVFTLGLTENWSSHASGDVFPLAPGVVAGAYDPETYSFSNLSVASVSEDLSLFLHQLKEVNPRIRVVLTVSPVPLIATFQKKNALVATTYSKSVLRVAAEEACATRDWVDYFPSYEIITATFNAGRYYEADHREVNKLGVSHAMRCFIQNYVEENEVIPCSPTSLPAEKSPETSTITAVPRLGSVVCDEELIESFRQS